MPGSTFSVIDPAVDRSGIVEVADTINVLPDDYYSMFYDVNSKVISYIMYIPKEYYNEHTELMQHSYILQTYGSHVSGTHNKHTIREYSGLQIRAEYSAVLNEILSTLKDMTGGGTGGLTEDQINAAVKDALDEYAEQERTEVQQQGSQADQLVEQLGEIVPAAKLQTALQGLTAAVSGNHRTCVLVLPEIIEPVTGAMIMEETPIDLTGTIQGIINGDSRIATLVDLIRWINLLVLAFSLYRSIMNIINYVTSGGDQA